MKLLGPEQMRRDGIRKLPVWGHGQRIGCATYQPKLTRPKCGCCSKTAGYETPAGFRCFTHTLESLK